MTRAELMRRARALRAGRLLARPSGSCAALLRATELLGAACWMLPKICFLWPPTFDYKSLSKT